MRRVLLGLAALVLVVGGFAFGARPAAAACPTEGCTVSIHGLAYDPSSITVTTAEQIFWCNDESDHTVNHTVTADGGQFDSGNTPLTPGGDCFGGSAGEIGVGDYPYHCKIHASMHGTLHVVAPSTTTTTAGATTTTGAPTTTTTVAGATTTTRKAATTTTVRHTTTTRKIATVKRATLTTLAATTTTSEETTTTEFETTTSEETTTTSGGFAINTSGKKDNSSTYALLGSLAIIVGGGGYLLWRFRYRFIR